MRHNSIRSTLPAVGRLAVAGATIAGLLALAPAAADAAPAHHARHHHHRHHHAKVVRGTHFRRTRAAREAANRDDRVSQALRIAINHEGAPYVYGATGPNAFDCSGLTSYAYHQVGFDGLPRTAAEQAGFVRHIPRDQMRPGDLVFFYDGSHVYHVGIYDGMVDGRRYIVHAPYPGESVRREAIWTDSWFAGTMR